MSLPGDMPPGTLGGQRDRLPARVSDALEPAVPIRSFALLNRHQLRAQCLGEGPHSAARHPMLGASINEGAHPGEHRGSAR